MPLCRDGELVEIIFGSRCCKAVPTQNLSQALGHFLERLPEIVPGPGTNFFFRVLIRRVVREMTVVRFELGLAHTRNAKRLPGLLQAGRIGILGDVPVFSEYIHCSRGTFDQRLKSFTFRMKYSGYRSLTTLALNFCCWKGDNDSTS